MNSRYLGSVVDFLVFQWARADPSPPSVDRLNLGSAYIAPPGWLNLDNSPSVWLSKHRLVRSLLEKSGVVTPSAQQRWRSDIIFHDVRHGLPWQTHSFRFIYTSHLLEHLTREEGTRLLGECLRVLEPGGLLRVVVPDLKFYAQQYLAEAGNGSRSTTLPSEHFLEMLGVHAGHEVSARNPHRWMYDAASLALCLGEVGFVDVVPQAHRQGQVPDLEVLDVRPVDSLHMEARRP
jgi:predicted SAM-dependent methyltransferase